MLSKNTTEEVGLMGSILGGLNLFGYFSSAPPAASSPQSERPPSVSREADLLKKVESLQNQVGEIHELRDQVDYLVTLLQTAPQGVHPGLLHSPASPVNPMFSSHLYIQPAPFSPTSPANSPSTIAPGAPPPPPPSPPPPPPPAAPPGPTVKGDTPLPSPKSKPGAKAVSEPKEFTLEELEAKVREQILQSDVSSSNVTKAVANYMAVFKNCKPRLERLVLLYPFLIRKLALKPKTAYGMQYLRSMWD